MGKIILYYYSGTGNTYRTAEWIRSAAAESGMDAEITSIEHALPLKETPGDGVVTGYGMPVHGFTIPWKMIRFLCGIPRGGGSGAFVWATRAGAKYGPVPGYPPGVAGSSIFIAAIILKIKGYKILGMMSVNMPSNWISLHSGLRSDVVEAIIEKAKPVVRDFTQKIISGKRVLFTVNTVYESVMGLMLLPLSAGYLIIGRFGLAKLFFPNRKCTGCGTCAVNCPTHSIKMKGKNTQRPYWLFSCESCMRCMGYCPHNAIEASQPLAGFTFYLTIHLPVSAFIYSKISDYTGWDNALVTVFSFASYMAFSFSVFFLSYLILWLMSCVPVINTIFTYTTLTSIYRRYHEPSTSLKDFQRRK